MYKEKLKKDNFDVNKLWGDCYLDKNYWIHDPISSSGEELSRSFCQFVMKPICQIYNYCIQKDMVKLDKALRVIGVE